MKGKKELSYDLPNGIRVEYPANEQAYYLSTILKSIFEYNKFLRGIIVGLSGRDIRKAMEIFLEFCSSGYISSDEIFKIRQAKGHYVLPYHVVAQVLLRRSRRFYDGDSDYSYIKNLFSITPEDAKPSYFSRLAILKWLELRYREKGPSGIRGYHPVRELKKDLIVLGLSDFAIQRDLLFLLKAQCVVAEHLRLDQIEDDDLIRLSPAGFVHLDLVSNEEYLAAVSEDTWFDNEETARTILSSMTSDKHYSRAVTIKNSFMLLQYLKERQNDPVPSPQSYLNDERWRKLIDIEPSEIKIERLYEDAKSDPWFDVESRYQDGQVASGVVENFNDYGVFIRIEPGIVGLIGQRYVNLTVDQLRAIVGKQIEVEILRVESERKRIALRFPRGFKPV